MAELIFLNDFHKDRYLDLCGAFASIDPYRRVVAYLLSLDDIVFAHRTDLFDFSEEVIIPEGINAGWQTSGTLKVTRMMFNLWNGFVDTDPSLCTPFNLFYSAYAFYFWQATCILFLGWGAA